MGYAYGQMLAEGVKYNIEDNLIEKQIINITHLPIFYAKLLSKAGLSIVKGLLDINWYITKPYTPERYE